MKKMNNEELEMCLNEGNNTVTSVVTESQSKFSRKFRTNIQKMLKFIA